MITEFGFVDKDFKPSLEKWSSSIHGPYFQAWQIDPADTLPAPVLVDQKRAAVWIGRAISNYGESPVIAVSLGAHESVNYFGHQWYVGGFNFGWEKGEFGKTASQLELATLALENALYGPSSFHEAMSILVDYLPIESVLKN